MENNTSQTSPPAKSPILHGAMWINFVAIPLFLGFLILFQIPDLPLTYNQGRILGELAAKLGLVVVISTGVGIYFWTTNPAVNKKTSLKVVIAGGIALLEPISKMPEQYYDARKL